MYRNCQFGDELPDLPVRQDDGRLGRCGPWRKKMGAAYYISLERMIDGFDAIGAIDGKALAAEGQRLDRLAADLGVRPLADFFGGGLDDILDPAPDEEDPLGDALFLIHGPSEPWFHPREGLGTVRTLRQHIRGNRAAVRNTERVLFDLECFERVLERAEAHGIRWHLSIDF
jgi:hypothetical protein